MSSQKKSNFLGSLQTLKRMSDFFILQCLKNIVRLGLEKLFMKVGYYDTE